MATIRDLPGELTTLPAPDDLLVIADTSDLVNKDKRMRFDRIYETGTWTPGLTANLNPGSPTFASNGSYYRMGGICFIRARLTLSNKGGMNGAVRMTNLPFTTPLLFDTVTRAGSWQNTATALLSVGIKLDYNTSTATFMKLTSATTNGWAELLTSDINDNSAIFNFLFWYPLS